MFKIHAVLGALLVGTLVATLGGTALESRQEGGIKQVRLGTFDSRAVAVAYYRSDLFKSRLGKVKQEMRKAKAASDKKRVKAIEDRMEALQEHVHGQGFSTLLIPGTTQLELDLQEHVHGQGFSTAPVNDILVLLHKKLPALARQAGVDVIVSKWDVVYALPTAGMQDVTDLLVKQFHPDEATLKVVDQLLQTAPLPLESFKKDH